MKSLSLEPVGTFPERIQTVLVPEGGGMVTAYRYTVPEGFVAFIYEVACGPIPEGGYAVWKVDGEDVGALIPEIGETPIKNQIASESEPLKLIPPVVCEEEVIWDFYSPVAWEFWVLCDGEVYELPEKWRIEEQIVEAVEAVLAEKVKEPKRRSTYVDEWKNITVTEVWEICHFKTAGRMHEVLVLSESSDFNLVVEADGRKEYEGSYSDYASLSEYVDEVVALKSDNTYRVHLADMPFTSSLHIYVRGSLVITKAYLKVELEESV